MARTTKPQMHDDTEANLRRWFPEGSTVHTDLRHVSASGMTRTIAVVAFETEPVWRGVAQAAYDDRPRWREYRSRAAAVEAGAKKIKKATRVDVLGNAGWPVAALLDYRYDSDRGGIIVSGCGMDMGFHVVYTLAHHLYGDGYALSQRWI